MLIPLGPTDGPMDGPTIEVPREVKERHAVYWWLLVGFLGATCVVSAAAGEIFGVVFTAMLALVVCYMVGNKCEKMSPYCLLLFGVMCGVEAIFESIALLVLVGGRTIEHSTTTRAMSPDGRTSSVTVNTELERHAFFERSMGFRYNMESVAKVCLPLAMVLGAGLAYWSYNAFPFGLLPPPSDEEPFGEQGGGGGYGTQRPPAPPPGRVTTQGGRFVGGGGAVGGPTPRPFEGQGQRLGAA
mmetsp:Transcript_42243/g.111708  ORF Transcript_42243/g.111708 Transcript_42243/m.111708 type:complete len:242 (+) Transcript_42243:107-832(+)